MKIKITLKDPDTLIDAIDEAIDELKIEGISEEELEAVKEKRKDEYRDKAADWFEYGEYVTLEFDTDKNTMTVVPINS